MADNSITAVANQDELFCPDQSFSTGNLDNSNGADDKQRECAPEQPSDNASSSDSQCVEKLGNIEPAGCDQTFENGNSTGDQCDHSMTLTNSVVDQVDSSFDALDSTKEDTNYVQSITEEAGNNPPNVVKGECGQDLDEDENAIEGQLEDLPDFKVSIKDSNSSTFETDNSTNNHCKETLARSSKSEEAQPNQSTENASSIKIENNLDDADFEDEFEDDVDEDHESPESRCKVTHSAGGDMVMIPQVRTEENLHENLSKKMGSIEMPLTSTSNNEQGQAPCRILTQYVFVNRPLKKKPKKKKFGLLYNQAFRHFQKGRLHFPSLIGATKKEKVKEKPKKTAASEREERLKRRDSLKASNSVIETVSVKKSQSKGNKKSKNVKQKTRKKTPSENTARKTITIRKTEKAAWKNSKKAERSQRKVTTSRCKNVRKRILTDEEQLDVRNALKQPGATIQSVSSEFGVAQTIVRGFSEEMKVAKKRKVNEEQPVIKEEARDEPLFWNLEGQSHLSENDDDIKDGATHGNKPQSGKRSKFRRELTIDQKLLVIKDLQQSGSKVAHVARKYGISASSASRLKKKKHSLLHQAEGREMHENLKRIRDCKAPELDKALLKWYRCLEECSDEPISVANVLLRQKSHDIAATMGGTYFPTINWILRWKYRHNIICKQGRIESTEELEALDSKVDMGQVLTAVNEQIIYAGMIKSGIKEEKADELFVCEHCGVVVQGKKNRNKKRTIHLKDCPLYAQRRDLTLAEKVKVVRALEKPGAKMVHVAKRFCISTSATSRIHKDRIDILARMNEGYINMDRKRSRVSKEPELEKALCDWYRLQYELGIHITTHSIREKAKELASDMGKDFYPSESWVFRWRHRNNVNGPVDIEEVEEIDEDFEAKSEVDEANDRYIENGENASCDGRNESREEGDGEKKKKSRKRKLKEGGSNEPKKPKIVFPRSVMCEKCGCVSVRLKNNRIRNMRHSKGCPLVKPRQEKTFEDRIKMLKELEVAGVSLSHVARKYGVSTSSVSRMKQKKDLILTQGQELSNINKKRIRDCKEPEVAKQLYTWYMEKQAEGIHVTGTKLKEKASKMAKEEGRDFKVSTGWLGRWKKRFNILFKPREGAEKVKKSGQKRRITSKKVEKYDMEVDEENVSSDYIHHNDVNNAVGNAEIGQAIQTPRMYFAQRYHPNPWDFAAAQQASTSCGRPKDFIATVSHNIPGEENQGAYSHMFHHSFETFALSNGYPVGMGVGDPSLSVPRDFLQAEENEMHHQQGVLGIPSSSSPSTSMVGTAAVASTSSHHHPHHLLHQQVHSHTSQNIPQSQSVSSLLDHHPHRTQHYLPLQQNRNMQHQQQLPNSNSMMVPEEAVEQQDNQVIEAFKIMSSFAAKKSLGADVQAALRTIEMTMKGAGSGPGKKGKKSSYTHI